MFAFKLSFHYQHMEVVHTWTVWSQSIGLVKASSTLTSYKFDLHYQMCNSPGMLTFPLPAPLKNSFVLVRSGESFADVQHEIQTNPVKKLRTDNALTEEGSTTCETYFISPRDFDNQATFNDFIYLCSHFNLIEWSFWAVNFFFFFLLLMNTSIEIRTRIWYLTKH